MTDRPDSKMQDGGSGLGNAVARVVGIVVAGLILILLFHYTQLAEVVPVILIAAALLAVAVLLSQQLKKGISTKSCVLWRIFFCAVLAAVAVPMILTRSALLNIMGSPADIRDVGELDSAVGLGWKNLALQVSDVIDAGYSETSTVNVNLISAAEKEEYHYYILVFGDETLLGKCRSAEVSGSGHLAVFLEDSDSVDSEVSGEIGDYLTVRNGKIAVFSESGLSSDLRIQRAVVWLALAAVAEAVYYLLMLFRQEGRIREQTSPPEKGPGETPAQKPNAGSGEPFLWRGDTRPDPDFLSALQRFSADPSGQISVSEAQMADMITNLTDARNNLTAVEFRKIVEALREFREMKHPETVDRDGFLSMRSRIIRRYEETAPYMLFDGSGSDSVSGAQRAQLLTAYARGLRYREMLRLEKIGILETTQNGPQIAALRARYPDYDERVEAVMQAFARIASDRAAFRTAGTQQDGGSDGLQKEVSEGRMTEDEAAQVRARSVREQLERDDMVLADALGAYREMKAGPSEETAAQA